MDDIKKFFQKLSQKEKLVFEKIFEDIKNLTLEGYDIKKMVGQKNIFRLRKGKIRVLFMKYQGQGIVINMDYRAGVYK